MRDLEINSRSPADAAAPPSPHSLEVRLRRRVERAVESFGVLASLLGADAIASRVARPLAVAADLRPRRYVVALSGGIRSTGRLNATSVARVRYAVALLHAGYGATLVVSGGPRRHGRPSAAPAMRALALRLGVAAEKIIVEERSSTTAGNAREVAALLQPHAGDGILLVTSALHMRRAKLCFARHGVPVGPAPVPYIADEDPVRASVVTQTLHEYLGLAYYRALGWI
jgi:uncharacterized SAM-binding protein YcdF (DUF218 family)